LGTISGLRYVLPTLRWIHVFTTTILLLLLTFVHLSSPLPSGLVPLHNACSYGHYEVAELLVRHGASVNVADLWKFTPLHEAAAKGKYEICKLLLKVVDKSNVKVFYCQPLFITQGHSEQ